MSIPDKSPERVTIEIPWTSTEYDGHALLVESGFNPKPTEGENRWTIRPFELNQLEQAPGLVHLEKLMGLGVPVARLDRLREIISQAEVLTEPSARMESVEELVANMKGLRDPVDLLNIMFSRAVSAPNSLLPAVANDIYRGLVNVHNTDNQQLFEDCSLHILLVENRLMFRARIPTLLVGFDRDAYIKSTEERQSDAQQASEIQFESSRALLSGFRTLEPLTGPLYGCLTPATWGFQVFRSFGNLLFGFGTPLSGLRHTGPAEPLQLLANQSPSEPVEFPVLPPRACSDAMSWWISKLDRFTFILTDPTVYASKTDNVYQPHKHLQTMISMEALFRRVHSMQTTYRDTYARLELFFSIMDLISSLLDRNLEDLCNLSYARKVLRELKSTMTSGAALVLIDGAERGVSALGQAQEGFFIERHRREGVVRVGERSYSLEEAVGHYIKLLRNGTHGFTNIYERKRRLSEVLLTSHTGELPQDLPQLGYLYLLHVLSNPEILRGRLVLMNR